MNKPNQLTIIGGGTSVKEGIKKGLWNYLKGKFTFGLNYSFVYFNSTVQLYVDKAFYEHQIDRLKNLPLIIGNKHKVQKLDNTIMIRTNNAYKRDLSNGVYNAALVGLYALSFGIYVLNKGEIFLLGYDFGVLNNKKDKSGRFITHFYQGDEDHRGVGRTNYYHHAGRAEKSFKPFVDEKKVKIYVVGDSNLKMFPKITYDEYFQKLNKIAYNQDKLREWIREEAKKLEEV